MCEEDQGTGVSSASVDVRSASSGMIVTFQSASIVSIAGGVGVLRVKIRCDEVFFFIGLAIDDTVNDGIVLD